MFLACFFNKKEGPKGDKKRKFILYFFIWPCSLYSSSLLVWRRSRQIDIIPLGVAKLVSTPLSPPLPSVLDEVLPLTLSFATLPIGEGYKGDR